MAPTFNNTARLGFRIPQTNQKVNDFTPILQALGSDIDAGTVGWSTGTFSARPSAGTAGRVFLGTDDTTFFADIGSAWRALMSLTPFIPTASTAIQGGQMALTGGTTSFSISLPNPDNGVVVGISNTNGGTSAITVTSSSANIYGEGLTGGVSSFKLGSYGATAILVGDGTQWVIVAGEQDTGWVALGGSSGSRRIVGADAFGVVQLTTTAGSTTASLNVPHGLGATPTWVSASIGASGFNLGQLAGAGSPSSTNVSLFTISNGGATVGVNETTTVNWHAKL